MNFKIFEEHFEFMKCYEYPEYQKEAKQIIPLTSLELKAIDRLRQIQKLIKREYRLNEPQLTEHEISFQQLLLEELVHWFKFEFFKWVDKPQCSSCHEDTNLVQTMHVQNIEFYKCSVCENIESFLRHNDPLQALRSRRGRCGEWAAAFTLICRSLNWDTRFIVAHGADHVWVEVYCLDRWIHCDPCEAISDVPYMYEAGWGRKFSYVMAYSHEEIQDVTWRYSVDYAATLTRRSFNEQAFIEFLFRMREKRMKELSASRSSFLIRRIVCELGDFLTEKKVATEDQRERTSGSLLWRLSRQEAKTIDLRHIWTPDEDDLKYGMMTVRYSITNDCYVYGTKNNGLEKWYSGVYAASGVFRKIEHDWKKVYISRRETEKMGRVEWRFSTRNTNKIIKSISIVCLCNTFKNGNITLKLAFSNFNALASGDDLKFKIMDLSSIRKFYKGEPHIIEFNEDVTDIYFIVSLSGGNGPCFWQHSQLFRHDLDDDSYPFYVTINFKKDI